uniref:Uncharacterized protein n=1 Tax=Timema monikensis TaxID=170555 RepID=A0A7R9DX84_9NEOP|nr:unnamed protein product [Timema monikensis]
MRVAFMTPSFSRYKDNLQSSLTLVIVTNWALTIVRDVSSRATKKLVL